MRVPHPWRAEYFIILTCRLLLLPIFANVSDLFGKLWRFHTGSMNIRHASSLLPLSLSDEQMQVVMLAVASLPTEKRDLFLRRVASLLRFRGGRRHGDTDVTIAVRLALAALSTRRGRNRHRRTYAAPKPILWDQPVY
jgi:hypothetical protein